MTGLNSAPVWNARPDLSALLATISAGEAARKPLARGRVTEKA